jgi:hypothetical protein
MEKFLKWLLKHPELQVEFYYPPEHVDNERAGWICMSMQNDVSYHLTWIRIIGSELLESEDYLDRQYKKLLSWAEKHKGEEI